MSQNPDAHQDPRTKYPVPEYPEQSQIEQHPGLESRMQPEPDYGYETYRGSGRLEGKRAVVTGGDSGIGRAVALAFAREGADVVISYLDTESADADETARIVEEAGKRCVKVPGDLSEEVNCTALIEKAVEELGHIDILVNNAAHQMTVEGVMDVSTELLDRTFKTNIYAMFWLVKAAIPHMPPGGSIINVGSAQAYKPSPALLPYSATKGAIVTFTEGLAQDVVQYGLRANIVAPGPVWTPIIPASMPPETVAAFGQQSPMGRPGQPVELSPVFVLLASDESSYLNGSAIDVTGGQPVG
ncbi:SDR family oxidoreductase [Rubrobacter indicoceani]|uniref:SDR family oxidoreductase n=1 Tax=Rubrobacter indicoceani TaxID=2051957 RepID=UPI000E5A7EC2|nr:SDR family oxidoreductase [Rubrobacter indicoceani]